VNIGNSKPVRLLDFIDHIEQVTGIKAVKILMPMQAGDVPTTWADTTLIEKLTGYHPKTEIKNGVIKFIQWYRDYYGV
jgi:UDP-glucuronate 4-epimerase